MNPPELGGTRGQRKYFYHRSYNGQAQSPCGGSNFLTSVVFFYTRQSLLEPGSGTNRIRDSFCVTEPEFAFPNSAADFSGFRARFRMVKPAGPHLLRRESFTRPL